MAEPKTLQETLVYFGHPDRAFEFAVSLRWPGGNVTWPRCGGTKHSFIKGYRRWFCYPCNRQFTLKVETIFEDSALGMDKLTGCSATAKTV
jgi:transposase-like protein